MTKYKVNRGDRSERGDKVISLEAKRKPTGNKGKHIEGQCMETLGSTREHDWVVGSQILTGVITGATDDAIISTVQAAIDSIYYVHFKCHTNSTLRKLQAT